MRNYTRLLTILTIFLFYCVSTAYSIGSIFTVSNLDDSGAGSLRQAIIDANGDGGATGGNPHIIDATGVNGTINLLSAITISNHITINGPALPGQLVIDGGGSTQIFNNPNSPVYTQLITNLVMQNGSSANGGAISNAANLTLENCILRGNATTGYGGAIRNNNYSTADLTLINCAIYGNTTSANHGGGIGTFGSIFIYNSTITGNSTTGNGGGIYGENFGGSGYVDDSFIYNSIIAGNTASSGSDLGGVSGYTVSYSLVGNNSGSSVTSGSPNASNSYVGTSGIPIDPQFVSDAIPGQITGDLHLRYGSLAINSGDNALIPSGITTDLAGNERIAGSNVDMGTFEGNFENVLDFDGSDDFVTIPHDATLDFSDTDDFTLEAWFSSTSTANQRIISKWGSTGYQMTWNTGNVNFQIGNVNIVGSNGYADGEWHHVAAVRDGTDMIVYVDGIVEVTGSTTNNPSNTADVRIGSFNGASAYFDGQMDEVRIWNVARAQAEIINNMGKVLTSATGLVASYDFNVGIPGGTNTGLTTLPDITGNGNDGTLSGFALSGTSSNWVAETGDYDPGYALITQQAGGTVSTASNAGLTVSDINFLQDSGDEIVFVSQSLSTNGTVTSFVNTNVIDSRWEREWHVTITDVNDNGGVATMTFDFDELGLVTSGAKYGLLYRPDQSSQFQLAGVGAEVVDNTVSFSGNLLNLVDGYYTIGELATVNSTTLYVDENAGGASDGTSWSNAFNDLEVALAIAGTGVEVWVAAGTYIPTDYDRSASFVIEGDIKLYGGFAGGETLLNQRDPKANATILSGDINEDDDPDNIDSSEPSRADNLYHIIVANSGTSDAVLDGFTIQSGNANGSGSDNIGGGIKLNLSGMTINNCVIRYNSVSLNGAGINTSNQSAIISNCEIYENVSDSNGGAIKLATGTTQIFNNLIYANQANNGAGIHTGIVLPGTVIANNIIILNSASNTGGGIHFGGTNADALIVNNTIYGNNAGTKAGGMYIDSSSKGTIKNNIIWGNEAGLSAEVDMESGLHADAVMDYNLISTGAIGMNGSSADPLFTDVNEFDFSLQSGSGAINGGDNSVIPADAADLDGDADTSEGIPFDFAGNTRVQGGTVDMGALEFDGASIQTDAGNAIIFNGTTDFIALTRNTLSTGLTYEAWVSTTSVNVTNSYVGNPAMAIIGDHHNNIRGAFGVHGGVVRYTHWTGSALDFDILDGTKLVNDGNWHHVAVTHNQSTREMKIYVDGVLDAVGISTVYRTDIAYDRIGASYIDGFGTDDFFDGFIDEVRVWNIDRSQSEIQNDIFSTLVGNESGLVDYYQFNEVSGVFLTDISSGNDGALTGFADPNVAWVASGALQEFAPASPSGLFTLEVSNAEIEIGWTDHSFNETAFKIERSSDGGASYTELATVVADIPSYSDTNVTSETGYWYRVRAINEQGYSGYTNEKFATTFAPPHNALDFDGTDDYVELFEDDLFTGDFTLEAWVNLNDFSDYQPILTKAGTDNNSAEFNLQVQGTINGNVNFFLGNGTGISAVDGNNTTDQDIELATWTHLAAVVDGTSILLYINGELSGSSTFSGSRQNNSNPVQIGRYFNGVTQFWPGGIDEVRIWSDVRSESEIQNNMFSSLSGGESNLVAYYKFDQGVADGDNSSPAIDILPDRSHNQNDGILMNFALTGSSSNWTSSGAMDSGAAPDAPTDLVAAAFGNVVVLTWTDNSNDESGFEIERNEVGGPGFSTVFTVGANPSEVFDNTVEADKSYVYRVRSKNTSGSSLPSNVSYASTYTHPGNALTFDGEDDYVRVASDLSLEVTHYTFETWAKINTQPETDAGFIFLQKGQIDTQPNGYIFGYFNEAGTFKVYLAHVDDGGTPYLFTPDYTLQIGEWVHFAGVYDGTKLEVFVNGLSLGTTAVASDPFYTSNEADLKIGVSESTGPTLEAFMDGQLDEIRIWSEARSAAQINASMNSSIFASLEPNLVAYYNFDQSTGTILPDHSTTGGNHGTLTNFPDPTNSSWITSAAAFEPYVVINTNDSGMGSLRQAIINANASSGETITFDIPGTGNVINLVTDLPDITSTMIIDGTTQHDWAFGDEANMVVIDGSTPSAADQSGLIITADDVEIYGLALTNFDDGNTDSQTAAIKVTGNDVIIGAPEKGNIIYHNSNSGIYMVGASGGTIQGNRIGTNPDGSDRSGSNAQDYGIALSGSYGVQIGGDYTNGEGNQIAGVNNYVILVASSSDDIDIYGNKFGIDDSGNDFIETTDGIRVATSSTNVTIGGTDTGQRNFFGASSTAISLASDVSAITIDNNYFGTSEDGNSELNGAFSNGNIQLDAGAVSVTIQNNVMPASGGVNIQTTDPTGIDILDNYFGVFADGQSVASTGPNALTFAGGGGAGNTISGNVFAHSSDAISILAGTTDVIIQNNKIGVFVDGTVTGTGNPRNIDSGIFLQGAVGANSTDQRIMILDNIIANNGQSTIGHGIEITSSSSNILIQGNNIGVLADGTTIAPNEQNGIHMTASTTNVQIGGTGAGEENIIAGNGEYAVFYNATSLAGIQILGNEIFCNTDGGIGFNGTPDLALPTIDNLSASVISGTTSGLADGAVIYVYQSDDDCDSDQGATFVGETTITSNAWSISPGPFDPAGTYTATVTTPGEGTSVFSVPFADTEPPTGYSVSINNAYVNIADPTLTFEINGGEIGADYDYTISSDADGNTLEINGNGTISGSPEDINGVNISTLQDGTLTVSVVLTDVAENAGMAATATVEKDLSVPTLSSVSIGLDPSGNPSYAHPADVVDIAFTSNEDITNVTTSVFSGGEPVTNTIPGITGGPLNWNIRYAPTETDTEGLYTFTIDFEDLVGNVGTQVTTVTDGTFVYFDQTAPTISSTSLSGDNLTLAINFDEGIFSDIDGLADVILDNFILNQSGGVATVSTSSINVISESQVEISLDITGVPDGTETITVEPNEPIYDGAGNSMDLGQSNNSVTLNDKKAPIVSNLSLYTITENLADIYIEVDETSTLYYVLTQSVDPPSFQQILDGQDELGSPAISAANYAITGFTGDTYQITGLSASTNYYVYWAAEDAVGNLSSIISDNFITADPPVDLTFTTESTSVIPLIPGTIDNLIYTVSMEVSGGTANFFGMIFTPDGTYSETDFDQFNFYYSIGVNDFGSATYIDSNGFFSGDPEIPDGMVGLLFEDTYTNETVYWYITADIASGATIGNTFGLDEPIPEENLGLDGSFNIMGTLQASSSFTISQVPSGYSVTINNPVVNLAQALLNFEINSGELGADYEYEISSSADDNTLKVTGIGTISDDPQIVSNVDVSALSDGELLVSVILKDEFSNAGLPATGTVVKDVTVPNVISITPSLFNITDADVGAGNFSVVIVYNESMDIGINTPEISFTPDLSSTLTFASGIFTNGSLPNDTYTATFNVSDANVAIGLIDIDVTSGLDQVGNLQADGNQPDAFNVVTANPEIEITGLDIEIVDGDNTPSTFDDTGFGDLLVSASPVTKTFTINNIGTGDLILGTDAVSVSGDTDFVVVAQPDQVVLAGESTTFSVQFTALAEGLRVSEVLIFNNDVDENPYNFNIHGTGLLPALTLLAPNGGGQFQQNTALNISFTTDNLDESEIIAIDYSSDGGVSWTEIGSGTVAGLSGAFTLFLDSDIYPVGSENLIAVRNDANILLSVSETTFEIIPGDPVVTISTLPSTGTSITVGVSNQIIYQYSYDVAVSDATPIDVAFTLQGNATVAEFAPDGFKLYESSTNDFSTATQIGTASYGNVGTDKIGFSLNETIVAGSTRFFWLTVDIDALAKNSNFNIANPLTGDFGFEIAIKNLQTIQGATYTIQEPTDQQITLISPVGGEQVVQNADFPIRWTTSNFEGNEMIIIEYSTDAGSNWNALVSNASALLNGTYNWFVDEFNFTPGSNYRIRVRTENNTTSSESASSFEVIIPDPTVNIATLPVSGKSLIAGSSANIIGQLRFDVTAANAEVAGIIFRFQGNSIASDFETGGFKLFSNSVNNFSTATQIGAGVDYGNVAENNVGFEFDQNIDRDASVYYWLTADISAGASVSSFNTQLPVESDFGLGDANKNLFVSVGASFNIMPPGSPSIVVTSPEGGSTFEQGNQINIGFSTSDFTGDPTLVLEYSANNGSSWTFLVSNTISGFNGSFAWTTSAAQVSGDNYKIRLRTEDGTVVGESSGTFEIISPPKELTLINPTNTGITVFQNSTYIINWSAQNFVGTETLIVEYSSDAGANYIVLSSGPVTMFAGKYNWFVNTNVSLGSTNKIRIRTSDGSSVVTSSSDFTVAPPVPPSLSLQSPNVGTVSIEQNSTFAITWQAHNFVGTENLFVEYSNDGGVEWSVIKTGTVSALNGKINWFVDHEIYAAGSQYRIRVRTSNNSLISTSPDFAITVPEVATISIESPNGGEIYEQKSSHSISFVTTGISRTRSLVLEYSINDGTNWTGIASGLVGQFEGNYNWFIDQSKYATGNSYKIRIRTQDGTVEDTSNTFFSIIEPRPVLTLLDPNGSEKIKRNSTFSILWDSKNFQGSETLIIEYSKDGGLSNDWFFIAQGTVSGFGGKYQWFINPATYTTGTQYKVRVRNTNSTALDDSDQNFQIVPEVVKSILVTFPNGGEVIEQNSTQVIKWNTTNFIGSESLVIEYTTSNAWQELATGTANSFNGSLNWFVDNTIFGVNTDYQVRVRTVDSSVSDRNNEVFSVVAPVTQVLAMIAPVGGEQIEQNETYNIRFSSTGFAGSDVLRLEYSNDGVGWNAISTNTVSGFGGNYIWIVDDFIYNARADYRIRIIDDASGSIISEGGIFEIIEPEVVSEITVSSPNTNEQISLNSNYKIEWSTEGIPDSETLIIEFSADGGFSDWDFLTTGTVSSLEGQYNWFVDETIYDLGISNKIRVRTADDVVSDESDDFFEIISPDRVAFNILSPNGGEVLQQNATIDILFNTLGLEDDETIVLEYSTDGFNWTNLATTTVISFNGKFSWFIDPVVFLPHQRYRIRIRNTDSSAIDESDDLFEIIEEIVPELTLTSLLGGEQIEQNSTQAITWNESNLTGSENINIDYSIDGGNNWLNLISASADQFGGEYVWYVDAATFAVGVNYKVRVQTSNGVASSESEQPFEVMAPVSLALNVVSPNGGEQIEQNSTFNIKFNSFGLDANEVIDIEWSTDGTVWNNIASNTVAAFKGSFAWLVDAATYPIGSNYLIRVQNTTNTLQDQVDAVFEVIEQKSITVLNPNGGEKLDQNRNFTIAFSTTGLAGDIPLIIEYSVNGGLFWSPLTDGTVTSLSGSFVWFVDRALFKASNTYSIRVKTSDGKVSDVSNALFSVIAPVATFANQVEPFSFTANWNKYPEATSYLLDVSTSKSFDTFVSGYESLSVAGLSTKVTGLYHDTRYYYRVRANVGPDYTSANSNVITVKLPVSTELKADSLLLVNVYNATNGENWTNKGQWLQGKVKDWYGVTFSDGSITALDLSNNNLSGGFPDISSGFDDLATVNLSSNLLTSVADLSSLTIEGSLTSLDITLNKLDFAALDAISDIRNNNAYSFNPQGLLLEDTVIIAESTSSIELNRLVGGTGNQYQWYKDGVEVAGGVDPDLGIVPLPFLIYKIHDGIYHVEVTNPSYAGLILETNPAQLRVSSLERDSLALLAIYDAMGGANWTGTVIGWRRDNRRVGDWTGVVDAGNRITGLNLPGRGVINDLPSDIKDITQIKSVDLSGNAITGLPDMTSLKKIENINVSGNKLEFDDFERNLDHLSKIVIGTQNPFGFPVDPVKVKAGVDYPISVEIGGENNIYEWERKAYVLYGSPASFVVQPKEVGSTVVLENLRFDNMGTYRCRITNPEVPGLTLVSNETLVVGTVDLQGKVYDNNGTEVNEGDIGMMVIRDLNTRYDSLINPATGQPTFQVGLDGYIIRDVPLGDYIIGVRSDPTKYIQTYYVSEYEWLTADTLSLRDKKGKLNINITNIPVPDPGNFGDGTFSGVFEEDDGLDDGRTLGRRRLAGKGCALKRRRGSGRGDADEIFDLYAYVETNDEGEFVFEELIPGTYRFSIEFPGIPMDENSFTEFVVSGDLREANAFSVLATATPEGVIHVGLNEILSIHKEYFGELNVYPNPAKNKLTVNYDKLTVTGVYARVVDLFGNVLLDQEIVNGFQQKTELDISGIRNGLYILNFIDTNDDNLIISTSKFVISR
ncbi:LamG-like jellyroll fold domain-containing protein [Reichenbachiella sp. MALMAid0571]|uniref:LamG-like jellyroll fold domain-containing protein n=1 Tax=Reichenbachiella sp. MALMAid0571 TaxID=3143939 RepID=UPI0032DEAD4E